MKNYFKTILAGLLITSGFLFTGVAIAECPTTNCGTDCGVGEVCSITQYENGKVCSWTMCYGVGPSTEM